MLPYDVRNLEPAQREALAWRVHELTDFNLPHLTHWNYDLCRQHRMGWVEEWYDKATDTDRQRTVHDRPKPGCRKCAIHFRSHQRVGIAWLYLAKRALLADTMGSGKTTHAGGLIAMLLETGEIPTVGRAVIVPRSAALDQWRDELLRMMPGLNVVVASGTRTKRIQSYLQPWDVLLIGPEMLRNDADALMRIPLALVVSDDIDQLRNPAIATSQVLDGLGAHADRYVIMSGTPLQKRLPELHSVLDGIGGKRVLGDIEHFKRRYERTAWVEDWDSKNSRVVKRKQVTGYQNLSDLKSKIAPLVLRRTQFADVNFPTIVPNDVMLDLYPLQRLKYQELQRGVIKILKEGGALETKKVMAMAKLHYGSAICAGLAALGEPDAPKTSVKMDWLIEKITKSDLSDEKVVVFANLKNSVRALQNRLQAEGVGFVTIWGENKNRSDRSAAQEQFWEDPNCRVLLGTRAIEQSLNLQVARHLVNVDTIMNPSRMQQLAGRVRRDGSAYSHVFIHNLLTVDTQEERYMPMLEREQALADYMWDENNELFQALSTVQLLQLISG